MFDKKFEDTNSSILNIYAPCYFNTLSKSKSRNSQRIHKSIFTEPLVGGDLDC